MCGAPVTTAQAAPRGGTIKMVCDPPLKADFIKIEIPGSGTLQLCEVTVDEIDGGLCPQMDKGKESSMIEKSHSVLPLKCTTSVEMKT